MQISNGDTPCDAPITSDAPPHLSCLPNVEEPMKYQALRPQFFSVGRWGVVERVVVVGWVVVGWG